MLNGQVRILWKHGFNKRLVLSVLRIKNTNHILACRAPDGLGADYFYIGYIIYCAFLASLAKTAFVCFVGVVTACFPPAG